MFPGTAFRLATILGLAVTSAAGVALGQQQDSGVKLPANPALWVNSGPITSEALKGKAAVLWFYEEGCPRCRAKWPELLAIAQKYEGKPVAFIGVNSGNARASVEQYAREVKVPWPIIVDSTREFEKAADVGEISLQNIYQMKMITSKGDIVPGNLAEFENSVDRALAGAKWNVEPTQIPASLRQAWTAIEFGDFPAGAATLKKNLTSGKSDVKEAATTLNKYVQEQLQSLLAEASKEQEAGHAWPAFKLYQQLTERFAGYDIPADATAAKKALATDPQVTKQLQASKTLDAIRKSLASNSATSKRGVLARLKKLMEDAPDTDAADEAKRLLAHSE